MVWLWFSIDGILISGLHVWRYIFAEGNKTAQHTESGTVSGRGAISRSTPPNDLTLTLNT